MIIDFEITEGKGNLRQRILDLHAKWHSVLPMNPVMVFDREGYDSKFFWDLIQKSIPFVCWDKYVNQVELTAVDDECFTQTFEFNGKKYSVFENVKHFNCPVDIDDSTIKTFELRHIFLWNRKTNHRTCGLAWDASQALSLIECTQAILSRWGAKDKYLQTH